METDTGKEINVDMTITYLQYAFQKAVYSSIKTLGNRASRFKTKNGKWKTTKLYDYQVDFCYLINSIKNSPKYIATKDIHRANELITEISSLP